MKARLHLRQRQRGVALPVMLIMMLVMLVTSIYLLKSSNSTTLAASNLAYDASLSRAADLGLHAGYHWLRSTQQTAKAALNKHDAAEGYSATLAPGLSTRDKEFWARSVTIEDEHDTRIEYAIHRLCSRDLPYDDKNNACVQTSSSADAGGNAPRVGESLASDTPDYGDNPRVHYIVTARIVGARGGTVVNQMVVLVGV